MQNYANKLEHLLEELTRIKYLIKVEVRYKQFLQGGIDYEQDFTLTASDIENLLEEPLGIPSWAEVKSRTEEEENLIVQLNNWRGVLQKNIISSVEQRTELRLFKLKQLFGLTWKEIDILLICLLAELDTQYQRLYGFLQDNLSNKQPSIDLILNLLSSTLEEKIKLIPYFEEDSLLFRYCILERIAEEEEIEGSLNHTIIVSKRIINYLIDQNSVISPLAEIAQLICPTKTLEELQLEDFFKQSISTLKSLSNSPYDVLVTVQGKEGAGRQLLAEAICKELEIKLMVINFKDLLLYDLEQYSSLLGLIQREAILQPAAIYWQQPFELIEKADSRYLSLFIRCIQRFACIHFFATLPYEYFPFQKIGKKLIELEVPNLSTEQRTKIWKKIFPSLSEEELNEVSNNFLLERGHIYAAAANAQYLVRPDKEMANEISKNEIHKACHTQACQYLSSFTKVVKPTYQRDSIILPEACQQALNEVINYAKYRSLVFEEGGFNKKLALGKGLIALFYGASGTGKTMAAEIIASSLDLMLCKIDLSTVISKYIGETEKHLNRIFKDAENSNTILFFDEADAVFSKRSHVQDAHDHYANIQTSYLLQKVEEYPGIVILATNFKNNLDEAFTRRLHFIIEFPIPKAQERLQIWTNIWPDNIKPSSDIDLQALANNLDIAGGNIRNIALAAAFRAAAEHNSKVMPIEVGKEKLILAIKQELQKLGRLIKHEQLNNLFK